MAIPMEIVAIGRSSVARATALDAIVATGNSTWMDVSGIKQLTVHVTGITSATIVVTASNAPAMPADATAGIEVATVTADAIVNVDMPVRWLKVRCTVWATGTISAYVEGLVL